jgi:hypothetical protein
MIKQETIGKRLNLKQLKYFPVQESVQIEVLLTDSGKSSKKFICKQFFTGIYLFEVLTG